MVLVFLTLAILFQPVNLVRDIPFNVSSPNFQEPLRLNYTRYDIQPKGQRFMGFDFDLTCDVTGDPGRQNLYSLDISTMAVKHHLNSKNRLK